MFEWTWPQHARKPETCFLSHYFRWTPKPISIIYQLIVATWHVLKLHRFDPVAENYSNPGECTYREARFNCRGIHKTVNITNGTITSPIDSRTQENLYIFLLRYAGAFEWSWNPGLCIGRSAQGNAFGPVLFLVAASCLGKCLVVLLLESGFWIEVWIGAEVSRWEALKSIAGN